jgi:hypothetical protein
MKHASRQTLEQLTTLLTQISAVSGLRARSLGVFYFKSKPFLHFHEDPAGVFADLFVGGDWQRHPVNSTDEQRQLLRLVAHRASAK